MVKKVYKVDGMHCSGCAKRVTEALSRLGEIKKVSVNLDSKEVLVSFSKEENDELVKSIIENLGFKLI
ncbi:MAG: heavy-metal-associated domain-containing protein [Eubacteriales bacterium]